MKKFLSILLVLIILGAIGFAYWYFMMRPTTVPTQPGQVTDDGTDPFQPLNRPPTGTNTQQGSTSTSTPPRTVPPVVSEIKTLRVLSDAPIGGYAASTTGTTTRVRWVDRGRGNIYEASYNSPEIMTLSNTVVPKVFKAVWNRSMTAFIGSLFEDGDLTPTTVYAELVRQATTTTVQNRTTSINSTTTSAVTTAMIAPFQLKGKNVPGDLIGYAASPDKTQVFMLMNEGGAAAGYVSSFDGRTTTRIFSTPATQWNVAWPSTDMITLTTKGSANYSGYMYSVNPKTGIAIKILGPIAGLSTSVSHDGKYVLYSTSDKNGGVKTSIYTVKSGTSTDAIIKTLADKCAWGNFYKELVYCGVPSQPVTGRYPDDWYIGSLSTVDKIWQVNAQSGEVHLISTLVDQSDRLLNTMNLDLDSRDHYLYFMNKNDLSLWSLDLVQH